MDDVLVGVYHKGTLKTLHKMNEVDHKVTHCTIVLMQNMSHIQVYKDR